MFKQQKRQPSIDLIPSNILEIQKKQNSKRKKHFKIKRSKAINTNKIKPQENFNNPLYADLEHEGKLNENKIYFGPWVQEELKKITDENSTKKEFQKSPKIIPQNHQRPVSLIGQYYRREVFNHQLEQQANNFQQLRSPQHQNQFRISSLMLEAPKLATLQPLKLLKTKQHGMVRNQKQGLSIDLLRYQSMKYLSNNQEIFSKKQYSKPNNVIFNYCCSGSENNLLATELQEISAKSILTKNILLRKKGYNHSQDQYKTKLDWFKNQSVKINKKLNLSPLKQTISQQLYSDLMKKKNKMK